MTQANPQAIDYPYLTTNTPKLTTHHTLIVCGALRHVCPCDDDMDAKEDDCDSDVSISDQFSWKQLRNATILVLRRQKPSTNALDGLYLPCVDCMLEARWVEGCAESLRKVDGAFLHPWWCGFSLHGRWWYTFYSIPLMLWKGRVVWALVIYSLNFRRWYGCPYKHNNNNKYNNACIVVNMVVRVYEREDIMKSNHNIFSQYQPCYGSRKIARIDHVSLSATISIMAGWYIVGGMWCVDRAIAYALIKNSLCVVSL